MTTSPKSTDKKKDTVYIEADDEITLVIDKVISSKERVVALVLPKRATVFQSIVNMKLLKKSARDAKKSLVIISSDAAITNMAALAKVHIAKTLSSKPEIPKVTKHDTLETVAADEIATEPAETVDASAKKSKKTAPATVAHKSIEDKTDAKVEINNKKPAFKIPDFTSFQFKLGLGGVFAAILIVGWIFGFVILPKAIVTVNTSVDRLDITSDFSIDTSLEESDVTEKKLRGVKVATDKEESVTVKATGQKNVGEKATGTMTITNCINGSGGTNIPAGSVFTAESKNFVTLAEVNLGPSIIVGGECRTNDFPAFGGFKDVTVQAAEPGEEYNLSEQSYASTIADIFGYGAAMSGGTTEVAIVVTQSDLDNAQSQLAGTSETAARSELSEQLNEQQLIVLDDTLVESSPVTRRSAEVDAEVNEVTVARAVNYSMVGVALDDVAGIVDEDIRSQLENDQQNIRSNGLDAANYTVVEEVTAGAAYRFNVKTIATIGPEFDIEAIKEQIAGQKRGEIEDLLELREGVRSVTVEYSPFWVFSTPDKTGKIDIIINEEDS